MASRHEVRVRATVSRVVHIDLQQQTFTVDVRFEASWTDRDFVLANFAQENFVERIGDSEVPAAFLSEDDVDGAVTNQAQGKLFFKRTKQGQNKDDSTRQHFFTPRLWMRNLIEDKERKEWWSFFQDRPSQPAIICYYWELKSAVFQQKMNLEHFPFDDQVLEMELASGWDLEDAENSVVIVQNQKSIYKSVVITSNFLQEAEYTLFDDVRFEEDRTLARESASGKKYAMLRCGVLVRRLPGYWRSQVILPLFVVTTCILSTFAMPPTSLGDRTAITTTLLLAIVAFKIVISDKLPNISYPTQIDNYVSFCMLWGLLVVVFQVLESAKVIPTHVYDYQQPLYPWLYPINASVPAEKSNSTVPRAGFHLLIPEDPTAQISTYLIVFGSVWCGLHILAVCYVGGQWRLRQWDLEKKWVNHSCSVWVSPVLEHQVEELREKMRKHGDVADVIHWTPEKARESLKNSRGAEGGQDEPGLVWEKVPKPPQKEGRQLSNWKLSERLSALLTDPEPGDSKSQKPADVKTVFSVEGWNDFKTHFSLVKGNERIDVSNLKESDFIEAGDGYFVPVLHDFVGNYRGTYPFAVVRFRSKSKRNSKQGASKDKNEEGASQAVRKYRKEQLLPPSGRHWIKVDKEPEEGTKLDSDELKMLLAKSGPSERQEISDEPHQNLQNSGPEHVMSQQKTSRDLTKEHLTKEQQYAISNLKEDSFIEVTGDGYFKPVKMQCEHLSMSLAALALQPTYRRGYAFQARNLLVQGQSTNRIADSQA